MHLQNTLATGRHLNVRHSSLVFVQFMSATPSFSLNRTSFSVVVLLLVVVASVVGSISIGPCLTPTRKSSEFSSISVPYSFSDHLKNLASEPQLE